MFATHQPATVREEESSTCIVWIGICLGVLVVHTMITGPLYYVILECHGIEDAEQYSER